MNGKEWKVTFCSGAQTVTGADFLLEGPLDESGRPLLRVLVDCGLVQGEKLAGEANWEPFAYDPKTIDYLFITHAHIDHIGGALQLKRLTGAPIYLNENDLPLLQSMDQQAAWIGAPPPETALPDEGLSDGQKQGAFVSIKDKSEELSRYLEDYREGLKEIPD